MATAVDSLQSRESTTAPRHSLWSRPFEYWHLLSLDAPTVAALWACFFARAMHIALPWHAPLLLALGTWLVYVADRILDGSRPDPATPLQQRHFFHRKHRNAFLATAILVGSFVLWLIVTRMTSSARYEDTILFAAAILYLALVHKPKFGSATWFPKELAVGLVFAAATAVPAWSRLTSHHAELAPAIALFAALCWLNCIAIERWENLSPKEELRSRQGHNTTRWAANHFGAVVLILAIVSVAIAFETRLRAEGTSLVYVAAAVSAVCLALIDQYREGLSGLHRRVAADGVLLTPLLFLPFLS